MSTAPRVLVTRRLPERIEERLAAEYDVLLSATDVAWTATDFAAAWESADAVVCTVTDCVGRETLPATPRRVRLLANFGVGVNHIDLAAATDAAITVTNTPGVLTDDTADLTIALMLQVLRRLGEGERELRAGHWTGWRPTHHLGRRLTGRTLGIVGYGRIGQAVAYRAHHGFRMPVRWFAPRPPRGLRHDVGKRVASLEELFAESDVVSLHCPATPDTRHLISTPQLARMRPGAVLINTARGDVVDEAALIVALRTGQLSGAGLDVFEREPTVPSELLAMAQVALLPHLGSATVESREAMGERVLANLAAFFAGAVPPDRMV